LAIGPFPSIHAITNIISISQPCRLGKAFLRRYTRFMTKRPTMQDVALAAGVSQATVSLVLNDTPHVRLSADTRARVQQAATALGYVRRRGLGAAAAVRVIGLLIDEVSTTPFAAPLLDGAREEAAAAGCLVSVFVTGGDPATEAAAIAALTATNLTGILYARLITRTVRPPAALDAIPTILLNCHDSDRRFPAVVPGDVAGAQAATELLIAAGHRRIAHLPGEDWGEAARDRQRGYARALAAHDLPLDPALIGQPTWTVGSGRAAMLQLLDLPNPPTAVTCFNDRVAIGAYAAAALRGLRVPQDLSVVGFDNEDLVAHLLPPLTTIVLPHDEMARTAVQLLADHAGGPLPWQKIKVDCPPVLRQSIAAPRN
jgi:LacI family transcriptional regulator